MTRKSMGILTFGLALVVFLAGCVAPVPGPAPAAPVVAGEAAATAGPAGEPIRIAIILPSSIIDMAWSQSMYDALKAVQAQMGGEAALQIVYKDNLVDVADAAVTLHDYATDGNDIIFAHGDQYNSAVFEVAAEFPGTTFAWGTAPAFVC
jgi:basic membrane protein A and related proteins